MTTHEMKLQPSPFEKIKSGSKTIEIRLNDEKRQLLKTGDSIIFSLMTDPVQKIEAGVVDLYKYQSFSELFDAYPASDFGGTDKADLMGIRKYYSESDEQKYGVLGIKIKYIRERGEVPQIIKDVGFDFSWSEEKVWALDMPVEEISIDELIWHFDIPFLWDKGVYDLKPQEVINNPEAHKKEYERTMKADLIHPIDIMENKGRWLILDGLHRLMKSRIQGANKVSVRKIPRDFIPQILKN
jgi:ASC-1-like (ASCH) protein